MAATSSILQFPHFLKPVQVVIAVISTICFGTASGVAGNGVIWFTVILTLTISVVATIVFIAGAEDQITSIFSRDALSWDFFEMVYSFGVVILTAVSVWLSFAYIGQVGPKGSYGGYIAGGSSLGRFYLCSLFVWLFKIFLCVQFLLFVIPTLYYCNKTQVSRTEVDPIVIRDATMPYSSEAYQSPI